jgi:uncharacterized membrane-anchored protein
VRIASVIWARHVRRSLWASLIATLIMALIYALSSANHGTGLITRFLGTIAAGAVAYITVVVLAQRSVARRSEKWKA